MTEQFDPYRKWLGIPLKHQPPNHYRLLGLELFEGDLDTIENAADQRMRHIRTYSTGNRAEFSQKLLTEISAAKIALLNPEKRAAYDAKLKKQASQESAPKPPPASKPSASPTAPRAPAAEEFNFTPSQPARTTVAVARKAAWQNPLVLGAIGVGLLAVVGVVISLASGGSKEISERVVKPPLPKPQIKPEPPNLERKSDPEPAGPASNLASEPPESNEVQPEIGETTIEKEPPAKIEQPDGDGNVEFAVWRVKCWVGPTARNGQWTDFPLEKMTRDIDDGVLTVTNTTGIHRFALLYCPLVLENDILVTGEFNGAMSLLGMMQAPGVQDRLAFVRPPQSGDHWCQFSIERSGEMLTIEIDSKALPITFHNAGAAVPGYFAIGILSGRTLGLRNVRFETRSANDTRPLARMEPAEKLPVPSPAVQQQSLAQIQDVFQDDFAVAKSSTEKTDLAKRLLQQAADSKDSPADRFVLLQEARRLAVEGADAETALAVVDATGDEYEIDPLAAKTETVVDLSKTVRTTNQNRLLAEHSLALVEPLVVADQFDSAKQLVEIALASARSGTERDVELIKKIAARQKVIAEIANAYSEAQSAFTTLNGSPDDPDANLVAGRFYCFVKGDWDRGVSMLAKANDAATQELAQRDLSAPTVAAQQVAVGDGWWELAEKAEVLAKENLRRRAVSWYQQALPTLDGLSKEIVAKRIVSLQSDSPDGRENTRPSASGRKSRITKLRDQHAPQSVRIGDHYYQVFPTVCSWDEAVVACKAMGGYLACCESPEEQQQLAGLKGGKTVWLGGLRDPSSGKIQWINGHEIPRERFHEVRGGCDFVAFTVGGKLNTRKRSGILRPANVVRIQGFVCEWDE